MIALDASVLIALLRSQDAHHAGARSILATGTEFAVHPVNLAEALVAPVRAGRDDEAVRVWRIAGVVEWQRVAEEAVGLARLRVDTGLRLPDCCPLLVAERSGRQLATFDGRQARTARARGIEVLGADE